jgi:hypothetical protein
VIYSEETRASARDKHLLALDKAEDLQQKKNEEAVSEADKHGIVGQINAALRTIQVIGQILRNFPGSLRAEVKLGMATETYKLGLRTLHVVLREIGSKLENAKAQILEAPSGALAGLSGEERERRMNRLGFFLALLCGYGSIKSVTDAVGSAQLKETYREIVESDAQIGFTLIDLAVRLDHLRPFPEDQLFDAYKRIRGNLFGEALVRMLALQFMYLYPSKPSLIQRVCSRLGIDMKANATRFLDPKLKLTTR